MPDGLRLALWHAGQADFATTLEQLLLRLQREERLNLSLRWTCILGKKGQVCCCISTFIDQIARSILGFYSFVVVIVTCSCVWLFWNSLGLLAEIFHLEYHNVHVTDRAAEKPFVAMIEIGIDLLEE